MSTPATPVVSAAKISFWSKIGTWFHAQEVTVENDIKALLSSSEVKSLEAGFTALAKSDLGELAVEAVMAATDINTGAVSFSTAASTLLSSAKTLGKSLTDSTVTTLIAAAQQKIQSVTGITTVPTPSGGGLSTSATTSPMAAAPSPT